MMVVPYNPTKHGVRNVLDLVLEKLSASHPKCKCEAIATKVNANGAVFCDNCSSKVINGKVVQIDATDLPIATTVRYLQEARLGRTLTIDRVELAALISELEHQKGQVGDLQGNSSKHIERWRALRDKVEEYLKPHNYLYGGMKELSEFLEAQKKEP
jgi:hypothetical protein